MRIFISVDIEGVAGVVDGIHGRPGNAEYERARRLMTEEANAAIRGAFAGGATEITVTDSHGPMRNLIAEDLDPRVRIVQGKPRPLSMAQGIEPDHDGMVLIGWHGAASRFGVLSHTVSGKAFSKIEIGGVTAGEPTLFAGHAAAIGVPLLAVSGDDRLAEEMAEQFPSTRRIVVKKAIGAGAANALSPQSSRDLIEAEVAEAVRGAADRQPEQPCPAPFETRIRFVRQVHADGAALIPRAKREDALTVAYDTETHAEAIALISALALIVSGVDPA
ncbi:M55 family metallopeptidase [Pseudoruegeria sp. HB172150]|uniref:M55 family metallopeptidase n=1 Tax=Pseudoruegeria sp. HB172150 TaxID=2721164 RepID=UPI001555711C|nr:M55 family metallopeptidase [Pseudoruegeria sp. HB172150]